MVWFCQEIMMQRVMSQIAAVKTDMIILEKSEFSTLLAENEVWCGSIGFNNLLTKHRSSMFNFNFAPRNWRSSCCSSRSSWLWVLHLIHSNHFVSQFYVIYFEFLLCVVTLQDVMNKVRADTLLDINLEKSRVKEMVSAWRSVSWL